MNIARYIILMIIGSSIFAQSYKDFCKEIESWPKGQLISNFSKYTESKLAQAIDAKTTFRLQKEGWLVIDARSKKDRKVGVIPKTIQATYDYQDQDKNDFKEDFLLKKIGRFLKYRKKKEIMSFSQIKDQNIIVFCNGMKCHRSSRAACWLRERGFKFEKLKVFLGGFPEWKKGGYPTR